MSKALTLKADKGIRVQVLVIKPEKMAQQIKTLV